MGQAPDRRQGPLDPVSRVSLTPERGVASLGTGPPRNKVQENVLLNYRRGPIRIFQLFFHLNERMRTLDRAYFVLCSAVFGSRYEQFASQNQFVYNDLPCL